MTPEQRNLARIARDNGGAWAAPGTDGYAHWVAMMADGLAEYVPDASGAPMVRFALTEAGLAMVEVG